MEEALTLRRSIWTSTLISLIGLVVFVAVAALVPQPETQAGLIVLSTVLALIPSVIWLGFFYQQDRAEPEPKKLVVRVFIFGAVAAALVTFLSAYETSVIRQYPSLIVRFILTTFTVALVYEVLKIAVVRYVVLGTNEFDRITDGIVYGLAAGIGFATLLTVSEILRADGLVPLAGAIRAVDNALVHGALGAVGGFYIGRVKIDGKNLQWMLGGLAIVTLGSSIYLVASREVSRSLEFNPWYSLGVALVLTAIVTGVLYYFYRRATLRDTGALQTVSMAINARSKVMPWDIHQRYDFLLIGAALLAAAVAVGSSLTLNTQAERYEGDLALTFAYPSGWVVNADEGGEWLARELTGPGTIKPVLQVSENKSRADSDLQVLAANFTAILDAEKALFVELDSTELEVAGQPAIQVNYSYAAQTASGPVVVRGVETYVTNGDNVIAMRYEAQADVFERGLPAYQRLLNSVQFQ